MNKLSEKKQISNKNDQETHRNRVGKNIFAPLRRR